jgi:hypothetical protein
MSLTIDISTIISSNFTLSNKSRLLTKALRAPNKIPPSIVYIPLLSIYPNSKLGLGYLYSTSIYTKVISSVIYFPKLIINVSTNLIQAITTIDVKPLKQYLANFWS